MDVDKGYAWVVMLANFGAIVVSSGLLLTSGIVMTTLQEKFQDDVTKTALVTSLYTALSSLAGPIGSGIVSRVSCRVAVATGSMMMTTGYLITAFSENLNICIFSCGFMAGMGSGITYTVLIIVNGFHFEEKLNIASGISFSGGGVGLFMLAPLLERTKEVYGYPGLFIMAAGTSLQLLVFASLMRPSRLEIEARSDRNSPMSEQTTGGQGRMYLRLFCDKATVFLIISYGFFSGGMYTAFMYWPSLCYENLFSPLQTSLFLSVSGISAIIGRLVIGILSSQKCVDTFYIYCFSLIGLGIACINFKFYASSTVGQLINAVLLGAYSGAPLVVFAAVTITCVGIKYLSSVGGLQLLSGGIGSIATPLISGYVVSRGGNYSDVLLICGSCLFIAAILVLVTKFTRKTLVEEETKQPQNFELLITEKRPT